MPPRIALVIHALYGGGAERLMSQLANRWADQYDLHLVTWAAADTDQYALSPRVKRYGLDLMGSSRNKLHGLWANWNRVRRLRLALRDIAPDLVLSFSDQMNIVSLAATRPLRLPTWIAEHSDPQKQQLSFLWEAWRRRVYPRCTGCVVLTDEFADAMSRWIRRERIRVIPPAIDPPEPSPRIAGVSEREPMKGPSTLLFVGRLSPEKGVDILLRSWQQIASKLPDWQLLIAGDGPLRGQLRQQAEGNPSVRFLGWTDNPWPLYAAADLFVLPSRYEGFPVALLEAMSQRVACVATECSGAIRQLTREHLSLETVPVESPHDLAATILDLAARPDKRSQLGAVARQTAAQYLWKNVGPRWDSIPRSDTEIYSGSLKR